MNLESIDKTLFLFLNKYHTPALDRLMFDNRDLLLWVPLGLLSVFIFINYKKNSTRPHTLTKTVIFSIFIILQIVLCNNILPQFIDPYIHRERPFYNPEMLQIFDFTHFYYEEKVGFYSSKACAVTAIATFFIAFRNTAKWLKIVLLVWAVLLSFNRIYIGAHYPFNILISDLLGVGIGLLTYYYYQYLNKHVMII